MAITFRISGGKLAATEVDALILGDHLGRLKAIVQANLIALKVLPVIEPGLKYRFGALPNLQPPELHRRSIALLQATLNL
jgi:hypothetical protein